eukprot:1891217-Rhodomonas_salina.1
MHTVHTSSTPEMHTSYALRAHLISAPEMHAVFRVVRLFRFLSSLRIIINGANACPRVSAALHTHAFGATV